MTEFPDLSNIFKGISSEPTAEDLEIQELARKQLTAKLKELDAVDVDPQLLSILYTISRGI